MAGAISSTGRKNYCTPDPIVDAVREFFRKVRGVESEGNRPKHVGITLDPSSNPESLVMAGRNIMLETGEALNDARRTVLRKFFLLEEEIMTGVPQDLGMTFETGDGLGMPWIGECVYNNPPFGYDKETKIGIKNWIEKALYEQEMSRIRVKIGGDLPEGGPFLPTEIVQCLPDTPETGPWKNGILLKAQGRCQLRQRVKFTGMKQGIPKPISLVYYGTRPDLFKTCFMHMGRVENPSAVYADQAHIKL